MKESALCGFDGCTKKRVARGFCSGHYHQSRSGLELQPLRGKSRTAGMTFEERFWAQVEKGACWNWTGTKDPDGYGMISRSGRYLGSHRVAYELSGRSIPPGKMIDHTCRNRACVNPAHLQAVTRKQNGENLATSRANTSSGVRGVTWNKSSGKWQAAVRHHRRLIHVGSYDSLTEAADAVRAKRNELFTNNILDRKQSA